MPPLSRYWWPWVILWTALLALFLVTCGCSSTPTQLARLQNDYDHWEGQYEDLCVTVPAPAPARCHDIRAALQKTKKDLDRAVYITDPATGKKSPRTGPIPLQRALCRGDEALLVKAFKEK